jgi:hypothetical protein
VIFGTALFRKYINIFEALKFDYELPVDYKNEYLGEEDDIKFGFRYLSERLGNYEPEGHWRVLLVVLYPIYMPLVLIGMIETYFYALLHYPGLLIYWISAKTKIIVCRYKYRVVYRVATEANNNYNKFKRFPTIVLYDSETFTDEILHNCVLELTNELNQYLGTKKKIAKKFLVENCFEKEKFPRTMRYMEDNFSNIKFEDKEIIKNIEKRANKVNSFEVSMFDDVEIAELSDIMELSDDVITDVAEEIDLPEIVIKSNENTGTAFDFNKFKELSKK